MQKLKNMLKRSIGVILFAFIPGMAAGSPTVGWFWGGVTGVLTVFSSIIIFLGVQLAWDADVSDADIEKGFRAAVAKASKDNEDVADAVRTSAADATAFDDFGDITDLFDAEDHPADVVEDAPVAEATPEIPQVPVEEQAPAPEAPVVE